jgi:hypothetical protein
MKNPAREKNLRIFFLTVIFVLGSMFPAFSCDVNLFALISGDAKRDEFVEATSEIAVALRRLGQNFEDSDQTKPNIKKLMEKWIRFSNRFRIYPPEWAKPDPNWKEKMNDLADLIGLIQKNYPIDQRQSHIAVIKFSRHLSYLYEFMPMNDLARFLLGFPALFDKVWNNYYGRDLKQLREDSTELYNAAMSLPSKLPAELRRESRKFLYAIEEMHRLALQNNPLTGMAFNLSLSDAETEFSGLNLKISEYGLATSKK